MKKYIPLTNLLENLRKKSVNTWFDKLSFTNIFLVWSLVVVMFGFAYYFLPTNIGYLFQPLENKTQLNIYDNIYFSFITATTTGFGDIIPFKGFRILALIEVTCGLLLLAFVTSKLVSIKQNMILNEIYEISLGERINRIRSSLLLFRQNIARIMQNVEEGTIRKREINDIYVHISSFEDSLHQISTLFVRNKKNNFTQGVDPIHTELLLISVAQSLDRLLELLDTLESHKIEWRREITIKLIKDSIKRYQVIAEQIGTKSSLSEIVVKNLKSQKEFTVQSINKLLQPEMKQDEPAADNIHHSA